MSKSNSGSSGGIGVLGLLGIVFVTLKLLGISAVASWSWWWVTAPFWGVAALALAVFLIGAVIIVIKAILKGR